ncbi:MAG: Xaa-Pro peptidase family protein [Paracoccaceae bacterium]|nr:Xaa-Pro peptidase family protein [Paracoccaceae bacterium]
MSLETPRRGFTDDEFTSRTHKAQRLMAEQGLSGVLLMTEPEVRYFSGFLTPFWLSPTRSWFLFVPADGKPIAVIPTIGAVLMQKTWVDDIRTWNSPATGNDGVDLLIDLLSPLASKRARVGVPMGPETALRMPVGDWERLKATLQGIEIVDATGLIRALRMVKSSAEIAKLAHVCAIGSATFACVPDFAQVGRPLEQVFRSFRHAALEFGADDVPFLAGSAGPGGYEDIISPPSRASLRIGDILMLDSGVTWDGYFCDFDRNFAIGRRNDLPRRAHDTLWRATEAGIEAVRPGRTCRDIFYAMQRVIEGMDDGIGDVGRLGHGLGMQLTEWPSIAPFDDTLIEENMVLTLEPSLGYANGLMMVHEEVVVVRSRGAELLTDRATPELPVI